MQALVLEKKQQLSIRRIDMDRTLGPRDARIAVHNVGICGSDVHYYQQGKIGPFVVDEPMVLGHEASGTVLEIGPAVKGLKVGDRICMEPGIPDPYSEASRQGIYNLDPAVRFWATPPIHGCLTHEVIHPADFCFKLPDTISFAEGALVEPLATGMQAADKARIRPGDIAVVIGAGTIGIMTALSALAGGCSQVIIADLVDEKLDLAASYTGISSINVRHQNLQETVMTLTDNWGANLVFEASGSQAAYDGITDLACPGGTLVLVGMPAVPVPWDIVALQAKELRIESVFRYAHQFPRALALMASGKLDLKQLISAVYPFSESIPAFERAARGEPGDIKLQIQITP